MRRAAFTLGELLIVLAVCTLLAAIVLPALSQAQATARRASCTSQLRQLQLALLSYTSDYEGELPLNHHAGRTVAWGVALQAYGLTPALQICPADPRRAERQRAHGTSYVLNEYCRDLDQLARPAETFLLFEQAAGGREDHIHNRAWRHDPRGLQAAVFQDLALRQHQEGVLSVCADGHLVRLTVGQVSAWTEVGWDFSEPVY